MASSNSTGARSAGNDWHWRDDDLDLALALSASLAEHQAATAMDDGDESAPPAQPAAGAVQGAAAPAEPAPMDEGDGSAAMDEGDGSAAMDEGDESAAGPPLGLLYIQWPSKARSISSVAKSLGLSVRDMERVRREELKGVGKGMTLPKGTYVRLPAEVHRDIAREFGDKLVRWYPAIGEWAPAYTPDGLPYYKPCQAQCDQCDEWLELAVPPKADQWRCPVCREAVAAAAAAAADDADNTRKNKRPRNNKSRNKKSRNKKSRKKKTREKNTRSDQHDAAAAANTTRETPDEDHDAARAAAARAAAANAARVSLKATGCLLETECPVCIEDCKYLAFPEVHPWSCCSGLLHGPVCKACIAKYTQLNSVGGVIPTCPTCGKSMDIGNAAAVVVFMDTVAPIVDASTKINLVNAVANHGANKERQRLREENALSAAQVELLENRNKMSVCVWCHSAQRIDGCNDLKAHSGVGEPAAHAQASSNACKKCRWSPSHADQFMPLRLAHVKHVAQGGVNADSARSFFRDFFRSWRECCGDLKATTNNLRIIRRLTGICVTTRLGTSDWYEVRIPSPSNEHTEDECVRCGHVFVHLLAPADIGGTDGINYLQERLWKLYCNLQFDKERHSDRDGYQRNPDGSQGCVFEAYESETRYWSIGLPTYAELCTAVRAALPATFTHAQVEEFVRQHNSQRVIPTRTYLSVRFDEEFHARPAPIHPAPIRIDLTDAMADAYGPVTP